MIENWKGENGKHAGHGILSTITALLSTISLSSVGSILLLLNMNTNENSDAFKEKV